MRTLGFLFLILIVVLAAGWYLDWFNLAVGRDPQKGAAKITLEVDENKIKKDTAKAQKSIDKLGEELSSKDDAKNQAQTSQTATAQGVLVRVHPGEESLTVMTEANEPLTVALTPATRHYRNGQEVEVTELRPGDRVTVAYREENGQKMADSVKVETGK